MTIDRLRIGSRGGRDRMRDLAGYGAHVGVDPARLAMAKAILARRQADIGKVYRPGPTQLEFHKSQAIYRLITAENRGGKSTAMAMEIKWALEGTHPYRPNFHGGNYLLVTTRRQQADMVWRKKLIEDSELRGAPRGQGLIQGHAIDTIGFSGGDGLKALKSLRLRDEYGGGFLFVAWSGDVHSWEGLEGIQLDGVFIDENAVREDMLNELAVRVRDSQDDPDKPGGGQITWAATETKVNPAFTRFREVCANPADPTTAMFSIPSHEVVAVTAESAEQAQKLMRADIAQARLYGKGGALDTVRIYPQFDRDIHTTKEPMRHMPYDNIVVGYDPGMAHETGMVIGTYRRSEPDVLHVWACFTRTRQTIDQELDWLAEKVLPRQVCRYVYDPSARASQKAAAGKTIAQVIHEGLVERKLMAARGLFRFANNDHAGGIRLVRDRLDRAQILLYVEEEGVETLARQMILYRGRPETNFTGIHGIVKKDDDLVDPLRYIIMERHPWTDFGPNLGGVVVDPDVDATEVAKRVKFHVDRIAMKRRRR